MEERIYQVFNLENYKNHLVTFFSRKCDKNSILERKNYIISHYTDEYLISIIDETRSFIFMIIDKMNNERKLLGSCIFDNVEFPNGKILYFDNDAGGYPCDKLFSTGEPNILISSYLIKKFLGEQFSIEFGYNQYEYFNDEEQVGYEYDIMTFKINSSLEEFDKTFLDYQSFKNQNKKLLEKSHI